MLNLEQDELQEAFERDRMVCFLLRQEQHANKAEREQARAEWNALSFEELKLAWKYNQERKKR